MPDITSVLERAAATPTRGPRIPNRPRWPYVVVAGVTVVVAIALLVAFIPRDNQRRVKVADESTSTTSTTIVKHTDDATITIPNGWYATDQALAWWLVSPHELFSIATNPLPPSPHQKPNEAACPSEIPQVAVDNIAADGAYLWIG